MSIWRRRLCIATAFIVISATAGAHAQPAAPTNAPIRPRLIDTNPWAPAELPGNGLAGHDFLYAGEGSHENMYIVRGGKITWTFSDPATKGEISDAVLMENGNILFAHQFGVSEITPAKEVVWHYDVPHGFEVHTEERVVLIQNGNPARLMVINKTTGKTDKEFELRVGNPANTHGQFRQARLTSAGTILVAHMDMDKVCEYDTGGKELWSANVASPWSVTPLKNGNILVASNRRFVREISRSGETVWEFTADDLPGYRIVGTQIATRLANGDTLINNWCSKGNGTAVQAFEVTADKKLVWALRSWENPDLGPSTIIQLLDQPSAAANTTFGEFK